MKLCHLLLCAIVLSTAQPVRADDLRCGDRLVSEGDTAARVRERCGAPSEIRLERKLVPPVIWTAVTNAVVPINGQNTVVVPIGTGNQFFRLTGPGQ